MSAQINKMSIVFSACFCYTYSDFNFWRSINSIAPTRHQNFPAPAVGAVVGATYPQQGIELRARMPHAFFLVPGYGAQGAKGTDIAGCFDANGNGAIVNASRSILCAWKKREGMAFDAAAREEALRMKEDLASSLAAVGKAIQ